MAEVQAPSGRREGKSPRVRAGMGRRKRSDRVRRRSGLAVLIIFALAALAVLAAGLLAASLTIFASPPSHPSSPRSQASTPGTGAANSSLVGTPIDGTILAVSAAENLIAIQPSVGSPVQALVDSSSSITRGGAKVGLGSLIPGEAVIVTFTSGAGGTLVVAQLRDIESVPTNTPSPTPTPFYFYPSPSVEPTPSPTSPNPSPSTGPTPGGGPPSPGGNGGPPTPG